MSYKKLTEINIDPVKKAKTINKQQAIKIYKKILDHTFEIAKLSLELPKSYYNNEIFGENGFYEKFKKEIIDILNNKLLQNINKDAIKNIDVDNFLDLDQSSNNNENNIINNYEERGIV